MPGPRRRQLILTVDQSGRGDHRRVQDAVDAAPANSSAGSVVVIRIKPGLYRQVVVVVVYSEGWSLSVRVLISAS